MGLDPSYEAPTTPPHGQGALISAAPLTEATSKPQPHTQSPMMGNGSIRTCHEFALRAGLPVLVL